MNKSTVFKKVGIVTLIGISLWYIPSYSESLNNIDIQSAEKGTTFSKTGSTNTNISDLQQETAPNTEEQFKNTNAKNDNQLRQQVNYMIAEQAREGLKDIGPDFWILVLKPMLFLSFFVGIPVWLFQAIRKKFATSLKT